MNWKRLAGGFVSAALLAYGCGGNGPTPITPPPATLVSVSVNGGNSVVVGSTIPLAATATYSDGSTQTVTATSTWNSSTAAATVATGVVTGVSAGATNITATFQNVASAPFAVQVTAPPPSTATLTSVTVSGTASVQIGNTTPLVATARFSDNSTQVVSTSSTWVSSANGVATVSSAGVVTGVSAGSASITATYQGMPSPPFSVQVTPLPVQAVISVFPTNPADGNENTCPIVPQPPSNKLDCRFDAVGSQPVNGIASYKWTIPVGTSNTFTVTGSVLQAPTVGCGNLSGISAGSTREVELTITTSTGATSTVLKSVTFTKATPC